jgi:hypothetical protein
MKYLSILFILYWFSPSLDAQNIRFNNLYNNDYFATNIKSDENQYISTFNYSQTPLSYAINKLDSVGNIITSLPIPIDTVAAYGLGMDYSTMSSKNNNKYIVTAISDRGADTALTGVMIAYNINNNTVEWQKSYQYNNRSTWFQKCEWLANNDILIAGTARFGYNGHSLLVLTDSLGNKRWERDFTQQTGYNLYFNDMAATPDGGFVLGCTNMLFTGDNNVDGTTAQAMLIKVDSAGNEQWRKIWGTPSKYDGRVALHILPDGTILSINQKGLQTHLPLYSSYCPWSTLHFRKWDLNGVLLSSKSMVQEYGSSTINTSVLVRPNGNLAIVPRKYTVDIGHYTHGYFEFTPTLDSVKMRYFSNPFTNPSPAYDNFLVGAIDNTPDGGLIASGYHFCGGGSCTTYSGQQAWVMKLDSNACEITDCYTASPSPSRGGEHQIKVFPNPANSDFTLQYSNFQNKQIIITDLLGRTQKTLSLQSETTNIPTQNLANGIYYVSIYENNVWRGSTKLVVQHE